VLRRSQRVVQCYLASSAGRRVSVQGSWGGKLGHLGGHSTAGSREDTAPANVATASGERCVAALAHGMRRSVRRLARGAQEPRGSPQRCNHPSLDPSVDHQRSVKTCSSPRRHSAARTRECLRRRSAGQAIAPRTSSPSFGMDDRAKLAGHSQPPTPFFIGRKRYCRSPLCQIRRKPDLDHACGVDMADFP